MHACVCVCAHMSEEYIEFIALCLIPFETEFVI